MATAPWSTVPVLVAVIRVSDAPAGSAEGGADAPSTMEEEDFSVVRVLLRLLDPSASSSVPTLRLACHDLGQFAMHHPHGRSVLRQLECYGAVAQLLAHADDGVRRSALLCTQKIMLSRDARDRLAAATSTV